MMRDDALHFSDHCLAGVVVEAIAIVVMFVVLVVILDRLAVVVVEAIAIVVMFGVVVIMS